MIFFRFPNKISAVSALNEINLVIKLLLLHDKINLRNGLEIHFLLPFTPPNFTHTNVHKEGIKMEGFDTVKVKLERDEILCVL